MAKKHEKEMTLHDLQIQRYAAPVQKQLEEAQAQLVVSYTIAAWLMQCIRQLHDNPFHCANMVHVTEQAVTMLKDQVIALLPKHLHVQVNKPEQYRTDFLKR